MHFSRFPLSLNKHNQPFRWVSFLPNLVSPLSTSGGEGHKEKACRGDLGIPILFEEIREEGGVCVRASVYVHPCHYWWLGLQGGVAKRCCVFLWRTQLFLQSVYINSHPCTPAHLHTRTRAHVHTCTLAHLHNCTTAQLHTCTPAHLHTCTPACTLAHLHTCTPAHLHTCTLAHLHTYTPACTYNLLVHPCTPACTCSFLIIEVMHPCLWEMAAFQPFRFICLILAWPVLDVFRWVSHESCWVNVLLSLADACAWALSCSLAF